jgi:hypothetical protein
MLYTVTTAAALEAATSAMNQKALAKMPLFLGAAASSAAGVGAGAGAVGVATKAAEEGQRWRKGPRRQMQLRPPGKTKSSTAPPFTGERMGEASTPNALQGRTGEAGLTEATTSTFLAGFLGL